MKHAPWMAGALVLALSGLVQAVDVDGLDGSAPSQVKAARAAGTTAAAVPAVRADQAAGPHALAIESLRQERQAFVQSFDWNRTADRESLRREYSGAMGRFELRELELKRDLYRATGQASLLAGTEAAIARRSQPAPHLPEISMDRQSAAAPAAAPQSPEVSR
jgi:hypothetical protein